MGNWELMLAIMSIVGLGTYEMPVTLELDQAEENTIEVERLGSQFPMTSYLVGGLEARIVFEGIGLLSRNGITGDLHFDSVRFAGTKMYLLGFIPTGTICIRDQIGTENGGQMYLRPLSNEGEMDAVLNLSTYLTAQSLGRNFPPLNQTAEFNEEFEFGLEQLLGLLIAEEGSTRFSQELESEIPAYLPLVGGRKITVKTTLQNVEELMPEALLEECEGYYSKL